ncbi:hypothetical protein [Verrucomicrobium spinosum]|uniref:hypothetical protein n=1 Tax=Verrucomicrobium spinosum TaxID=2736 RepID=UPI000174471C|nr:hypothetical protein [Verrucomicrobium spinosum]
MIVPIDEVFKGKCGFEYDEWSKTEDSTQDAFEVMPEEGRQGGGGVCRAKLNDSKFDRHLHLEA